MPPPCVWHIKFATRSVRHPTHCPRFQFASTYSGVNIAFLLRWERSIPVALESSDIMNPIQAARSFTFDHSPPAASTPFRLKSGAGRNESDSGFAGM